MRAYLTDIRDGFGALSLLFLVPLALVVLPFTLFDRKETK